MTDSLVSRFGVSSRNFITVCTILVMACLSWPCFFERSRTWSLSRVQSPESLLIVTIVMSNRDAVGKSLDYVITVIRIRHLCVSEMALPYLSGLLLQH